MWLLLLFACNIESMVTNLLADGLGNCEAADPEEDIAYTIEIPTGTHSRNIGAILEDNEIIENAGDFTTCVRFSERGDCEVKAGRFELTRGMDVERIFEVVCGDPIPDIGEPLTITPGWRIREIDAALTARELIAPGEYRELVTNPEGFEAPFPLPTDSLEGYLYPETYMIDPTQWDTREFVQRQLNMLTERFYEPNQAAITTTEREEGRSFHQLVIVGSMLEREEPTAENRPLVSGVIWKRLDDDWNLGIDATSRYTLDEWNDRAAFLIRLRDESDPYNTRLRPGLPPTAIGNPTLSALEAALSPEESEYWYYLHDDEGQLHPSRNSGEHEALRRRYNVY